MQAMYAASSAAASAETAEEVWASVIIGCPSL